MSSTRLYLRLLGYVRPYLRMFAISILGILIVAATEVALPAAAQPFLDGTFLHKDPWLMRWAPVGIVLLFAVRGLGAVLGQYASNWVSLRVIMDLRQQMFARLLALPLGYFADNLSGKLISKFTFDVIQIAVAVTYVVTVLVRDSVTIVALLAYLLWLNWKLTLITFAMIPPIAIVVRLFNRRLRGLTRQTQHAMGDVNHVLQESIDNQKMVKIFGGQAYEVQRFGAAVNRVRRLLVKEQIAAASNVPVVQLLAAIAVAVVLARVTADVQADRTTVGAFVSFIAAMLLVTAPLKRLTGIFEHLQRGLSAAESVFALVDQQPEDDPGAVELGRARGLVRFERLTFRYPGAERAALKDIDLEIRSGETVALVGQSGSGKTTLANLVPRFFHASSGRILVDGHDIESIRLASLRANIGLVSQDVTLFNDTVAANIAYGGKAGASGEDIVVAAKAAHAWEFIQALPNGLDTLVGENGVKLSGGQRQRLAIARAIVKKSPIVVFDDSFSALDFATDARLRAAIDRELNHATVIIVAQRVGTIMKADQIVVMDAGRIVGIGTHQELLDGNETYQEIVYSQLTEEEAAA